MALRWLSCSTAVLLLLVHIVPADTQNCNRALNGIPGIPGTHGPNGRDGAKGEKGDPGEAGQPIRGQKGAPGPFGPPGRSGMKGEPGLPGPDGFSGQPGEKGRPFNPSSQQKSFFSYKRLISTAPEMDTPIIFNGAILPDLDKQLQGELLTNETTYVCSVKGVYFFSYHISARSKVCLKLEKNGETHSETCDQADGFLVTSGSAVLELEVGDTVALKVTRHNYIVEPRSTSHTFTGFLIFPTA
ncbi:complement C1q subcomponent subunit B-like [Archocentrus centrarchus]|uniref:complement C1q subcomponent subunit B-like n=1 Tax=Archocentrus centrarchus TaxID=63155 RepID=UPI0011E9F1E9|nr:complement C1q subcomponent subunit B-like [Archocentrus centrarchus]